MRRVSFVASETRVIQFQYIALDIVIAYVLRELNLPGETMADVRVNGELVPTDQYGSRERGIGDDDFVEIRVVDALATKPSQDAVRLDG